VEHFITLGLPTGKHDRHINIPPVKTNNNKNPFFFCNTVYHLGGNELLAKYNLK
jgi:hypothetical protein